MPSDIHNEMTVVSLRPDKKLRFNIYGAEQKVFL